jgi:serine/threonine-protein phosphatase with EF-hands
MPTVFDGVANAGDAGEQGLFRLSQDSDLDHRELSAIKTIQNSVRRNKALSSANKDVHWTFFAQVDTLEENETMAMSSFLQNLIALVPGADCDEDKNDEIVDGGDAIFLEDIVLDDEDGVHHNTKITLTDHLEGNVKLINYKGAMNAAKAREIIGMMRSDFPARLDSECMRKLMRNVYKRFKQLPNTTHFEVPETGKVVVVGDIHGQLEDLLLILEDAGEPSEDNIFLFNGDFVDRGPQSCEVITILFALYAAFPGCVFMNRGNHEDTFICQNYGFQEEVVHKYDLETFFMFGETFKHLPLFSIISDAVFVVHGGLFCDPTITLKDLEQIDRTDFMAVPPEKFPQNTEGKDDSIYRTELLKQLQRDALWSDPRAENGIAPNHRGAGVTFGPDHTKQFLHNNKLSMVIRSHEMCPHGVEFPYATKYILDQYLDQTDSGTEGANARLSLLQKSIPLGEEPLLCTLFSASNYCSGDNEGAFLVLRRKGKSSNTPTYANSVGHSDLFFTTHRYRVNAKNGASLAMANKKTCMDLLIRKKRSLMMAFRNEDKEQDETVSFEAWSQVMSRVTALKIRWLGILKSVVPADAIKNGHVRYMDFLNSIHKHSYYEMNAHETAVAHGAALSTSSKVMEAVYGNKKRTIETIFKFFDTDGNGEISPVEFKVGCEKLNKDLKPDDPRILQDIDHVLSTMDFDHSGMVDMNEFFECFRLLNRYQQNHTTPGGSVSPRP